MSSNPDPSDADLVTQANAGNPRAFETLYRRYRDWAARLAFRFLPDEQLAQDVVQEVFIWLAGKFPGFTLRARLTTLLYPAIKHTAETIRKRRRRHLGTPTPIPDTPAPIETGQGELAEILAALSPPHREVLLMRFVDDMSTEEIAAALQIPTGTVKSRIHHALAALREDPRTQRYFTP